MNEKEVKAVNPSTLGWLEYKLNSQEMDYVWRCIKNKKEDLRHNLAGHVSNSNVLIDRSDWFYIHVLKPLIGKYEKEWGNIGDNLPTNTQHPYFLSRWWVNYQKQLEFNPLHNHSGVYSFVIWMKIPYTHEKQNRNPLAKSSNGEKISAFQFLYSNILGENMNWDYKLSPPDEGTLIFFPARLHHQVYPFYDCDEDRISVSGNIGLNTTKTM